VAGIYAFKVLMEKRKYLNETPLEETDTVTESDETTPWLVGWVATCIIIVVGAALLYLPYYLDMESPVSGIVPWDGDSTRFFHYFVIFGVFLFVGLSFVIMLFRQNRDRFSWLSGLWLLLAFLVIFIPWLVWVIASTITDRDVSVGGTFAHILPSIVILCLIIYVIGRTIKYGEKSDSSAVFAFWLFFAGVLFVMGCELFRVDDSFGRMNTVFRFYFQSWVLFAISSAFGVYYVARYWRVSGLIGRIVRGTWWAVLVVLILAALAYTGAAIPNRANAFVGYATLDGLAFLQRYHPDEAQAITWLNDNISGAPVILEAPGICYSDHGRVSAYTGLPTVLGWKQHEETWRSSDFDDLIQQRYDDIRYMYQSEDFDQVAPLLEKYDVSYIYVGRLERQDFGTEITTKFDVWFDVAFRNDGVTIYKVNE